MTANFSFMLFYSGSAPSVFPNWHGMEVTAILVVIFLKAKIVEKNLPNFNIILMIP